MRWKKFISRSVIAILLTLIVSELILRTFGYTGILSSNAFRLLLAPSASYLILFENLVLFLIVILSPPLLAKYYHKKHPVDRTYDIKSQKSEKITTIVLLPPPKQAHTEGKGLIFGSLISLVYTIIDFFLIRPYLSPSCSVLCGMEDLIAFGFSSLYFFMGLMFKKKS